MTPSSAGVPPVLDWIRSSKIVPVVRAGSPDEAMAAVECLLEGGIDVLEITMTVPGAVEVVREVAKRFPERALVGAGSVLSPEAARQCVEAGARFIVSPALDLATVEACKDMGVAVAPGALTPTEILAAWRAGVDIVKVFPADAMGGPSYIKSLKAPFPDIPLLPTGGVTLENAKAFLDAGAEAVGVGTDLADVKMLREGRRAEMVDRARAFLAAIAG